jgi:ribonuclease VapC
VNRFVLDASAVLAFVKCEPGGEGVGPYMNGGLISSVNYAEVLKKSTEYGGSIEVTAALLDRSQLQIIVFDAAQAIGAAKMWPSVKSHGLSFADRACLGLGIVSDAVVLTADKAMTGTGLPVRVRLIRDRN